MRRYNHNLEACREMFPSICTTHTYDDRVATAQLAIDAGMELCCGGILGMGETLEQRVDFAFELADLEPCEVPINFLLARDPAHRWPTPDISPREALQAIALFRLILPVPGSGSPAVGKYVLGELQAMGLLAGAERADRRQLPHHGGRPPRRTTRCSRRWACPWPTASVRVASCRRRRRAPAAARRPIPLAVESGALRS